MSENKKDIYFSLFLLFLSILIYTPNTFKIAHDLHLYISNSSIIFDKQDYSNQFIDTLDLKIGFLTQLKILDLNTSNDLNKIFYLILFHTIGFFISIYFLFKKVTNRKIAALASILILTSQLSVYWFPRHIDIVWPFYMVLFLIFFQEKNKYLVVLSSLFLFIAILIKKTNIFIYFFPLIYFLYDKNYEKIIYFYISTIFFYLVYLLIKKNFIYPISIERQNYTILFDFIRKYPTQNIIINFFHFLVTGFFKYFINVDFKSGLLIKNYFLIFGLFGFFFELIKKNIVANKFLILIILLSPSLILVGHFNGRYSQNIIVITILYLFTCIVINRYFSLKKFYLWVSILIIVNIGINFTKKETNLTIKKNYFLKAINQNKFDPPAKTNLYGDQFFYRFYKNYYNNKKIMVANNLLKSSFFYLSNKKIKIFSIPINQIGVLYYWPYYSKTVTGEYYYDYMTLPNSIFSKRPPNHYLPLATLSEQEIIQFYLANNIHELHITSFGHDKHLYDYFKKSKNFKLLKVFKINKKKIYVFNLHNYKYQKRKFEQDVIVDEYFDLIKDQNLKNIYKNKLLGFKPNIDSQL